MLEQSIKKSAIFRILAAQFITTLIVAFLALVIGPVATKSALLAGVICILPGLFSLAMSQRSPAHGESGLGLVLKGEIGRLLLASVLFVVVFTQTGELHVLVLFGTVVVLQAAYAVVPMLDARRLMQRVPKAGTQ